MFWGVDRACWPLSRAIELARAHQHAQDTPGRLVDDRLLDLPITHGLDEQAAIVLGWARHFQVEAAGDGLEDGVVRAPVGHDKTIESPLLLQDTVQQVVVLAGIDAVDPVVGAHNCPGLAFFDGRLEGRQIDLSQGALVEL